MSLETVLKIIEAEGEQTINKLQAASEKRVQLILAEAKEHANKMKDDWLTKRESEARAESARIRQQAYHTVALIQQQTRNQIIDSALQMIHESLTDVRQRSDYADVLEHLIIEAYTMLSPSLNGNERSNIEADPRDADLINTLLESQAFMNQIGSPTVQYTLDCTGGVNFTSEDGRIVVRNTLENRFEQAIPAIRRYLVSLFEREAIAESPS